MVQITLPQAYLQVMKEIRNFGKVILPLIASPNQLIFVNVILELHIIIRDYTFYKIKQGFEAKLS